MSAAERAQIRRATLAAQKALETLDQVGAEELARLYQAAAEALRSAIARHGGGDGSITVNELRSVLAQVENILANLSTARNGVVDAGLVKAAQSGASGAVLNSAASMRVAEEAVTNTVRLSPQRLRPTQL